jgi:hypothetical protein
MPASRERFAHNIILIVQTSSPRAAQMSSNTILMKKSEKNQADDQSQQCVSFIHDSISPARASQREAGILANSRIRRTAV